MDSIIAKLEDAISTALARAAENDFNSTISRRCGIHDGDGPNHYDIAANRYRNNAVILSNFLNRLRANS